MVKLVTIRAKLDSGQISGRFSTSFTCSNFLTFHSIIVKYQYKKQKKNKKKKQEKKNKKTKKKTTNKQTNKQKKKKKKKKNYFLR